MTERSAPHEVETVLSRAVPVVPIAVGDDVHQHDLVTSHGADGPFTAIADGDLEMGLGYDDGGDVPRLRLRSDLVTAVLAGWRSDIVFPIRIDGDDVETLWRSLRDRFSDVRNPGRDLEYALWIGDLCEQALTERATIYCRFVDPAEPPTPNARSHYR